MPRLHRSSHLVAAIFALAATILAAQRAQAFCRTVSEAIPPSYNPSSSGCFTGSDKAKLLYWKNACVGYSLARAASSQVTLEQATKVAADAFESWSGATCDGGGNPSINAVNEGPVDCDLVEYNSQRGPNQHVILFRDDAWPHTDSNNTLGLTTVTFDTRTGELYDADMEINSTIRGLTVDGSPPAGGFDLNSIITHEAGHFLGLAHAPDPTAIMFAHYHAGPPMLTLDDVDGVCTIYPPNGTRSTSSGAIAQGPCDPTSRHGFSTECGSLHPNGPAIETLDVTGGGGSSGCSVARSRSRVAFAGALLFAFGLLVRRRSLFSLASALLCVTLGHVAAASVAIAVSFDELVHAASAVAVVTPVEQRAVWEQGRIYTYTRVRADVVVAGSMPDDAWIQTMGGVVGDIGQSVEGEAVFVVGAPSLLFLERRGSDATSTVLHVTARAQGQFGIVSGADKTPRLVRAGDIGLLMPNRPLDLRSRLLATDVLRDRALDDAVRTIASAWQRLHAR